MDENIFVWIMNQLAQRALSLDEQRELFKEFVQDLTREEKIIVFLDMIAELKQRGISTDFRNLVKETMQEKQDRILDDYNDGRITREEMIEMLRKEPDEEKIETAPDSKRA
jgi:hypothetical protein